MRTIGSTSDQHHFFVLSILSILTFSMAASVALGRRSNGWGNHYNHLSISSAGPSSGPAAGGTTVTLSGTGFTSPASVYFGGTAASSVVVVSSTKLQAVTRAHASGTVSVAVTEGPHTQSATLAGGFTYTTTTTLGVSALPRQQGRPAEGQWSRSVAKVFKRERQSNLAVHNPPLLPWPVPLRSLPGRRGIPGRYPSP